MGIIAAAVRELIAAGLSGDELVSAVERIEDRPKQPSGAARRMRGYRRRRTELGMVPNFEGLQFRGALIQRDGERCIYCESSVDLVIDHIHPIAQGGTDDLDNLGFACRPCNGGKSGRTPEQAGMTIRIKSAGEAYRSFVTRTLRTNANTANVTHPPCPPNGFPSHSPSLTPLTPQTSLRSATIKSDWPDDFKNQFWEAYPRHVGKKAAMQKLELVHKSGEVAWEPFIESVRNVKADDPKFIPHPLTWLTQGRYLDGEAAPSAPVPDWVRDGLARQEAWRKEQNGQAANHQSVPGEGGNHDCSEQGIAKKEQRSFTDF